MMQAFLFLLTLTASLADQIENFVASSQLFTGDVYTQLLLANDGNFLVSPFSAETVFALTQSGAVGATGEEIRSVLHLPSSKEETEEAIGSVLPTLTSTRISLITANKIYVEDGLVLKDDFQAVARDVYQSEFQNVDFAQSSDAAAKINGWVEEKTNDKIKDLFSPDDFSGSTRIVLVNALYFKANWTRSFDPYDTKKAKFYTSEENTIDSDFMFLETQEHSYFESKELDAQILELPFQGGDASMIFVLPQKKEGIALLEKDIRAVLSAPKFQKLLVKVQIPKFKIETTIDFKKVLQQLGIQKAFSSEADFSGIAGQKGELFLTKAVQKTYIDVNEYGVEAAAATGTGGEDSEPPSPWAIFKADHPFIFYIKFQGVILFEGRVLVPQYN